MVNPFASRVPENKWILPVSLMTLLVGFMTSLAWIDNDERSGRLQKLTEDQRQRFASGTLDLTKENENLRLDLLKIREENTKLQNAVAQNSNASESLNKSLQELKLYAGLTEVVGPGVAVTLKDVHPKGPDEVASLGQIIHDTDVLRVVNELKSAGAEAISVNGRRVGTLSHYRCVGPTILVDDTKIASPVVIRAIGDSDTLFGAMNLPGGILDDIRQTDPKMVEIQPIQKMRIPPFSGPTTFKIAEVPEDKR